MARSSSEILPGLLVGPKPPPGRHPGIDVIVLAAVEYQPPAVLFPGSEVIHAPFDDAGRAMREDEVVTALQAASRVARRVRAGRRVLVSCQMGLNRSALIAALAIMELQPDRSLAEIKRRIRAQRGAWALSNPGFKQLLRVVDLRRAALRSRAA